MEKRVISTDDAPAAIGPYSQAIKIDKLVFVSGQIPIIPSTGETIQEDIKLQTEQVLKNLENILIAAGSALRNVVKTTIFMKDINDYAAINEVYKGFFTNEPPARSAVQVVKLPRGVDVEIEAIASIA